MIAIDVRDTIRETIADITYIQDGIGRKAAMRGVNRAAEAVRTGASKELRKVYNLKHRVIVAATKLKKATIRSRAVQASVIFSGRPIPVIEFDARWTRNMTGASVRIKVGGPRKNIRGAFIATTGRNITGVFRRVGNARYPIKQLRSIAIPDGIRNDAVNTALVTIGHERFKREFIHQIKFLTERKDGG